jgi:hypothetical protein
VSHNNQTGPCHGFGNGGGYVNPEEYGQNNNKNIVSYAVRNEEGKKQHYTETDEDELNTEGTMN